MASMQSLVVTAGVTCVPASGISGVSCQLARRARESGGRKNAQGRGGGTLLRMRGQAPAEDGGGEGTEGGGGDDDFEARLARIRRKSASGTGKKAEMRKARKEGGDAASAASPATAVRPDGIFIEPVPLKEAVSDGVNVELGLTPYTERLHGRLAALGVAAVLLVELATGDSLIKFHDYGTLTVQVYAVFGAAALFVKFEKERRSVWPKS